MTDQQPPPPLPLGRRDRPPRITRAQYSLAAMLGVALVGSLIGNFLRDEDFARSGLYFVALPGFMAILLSLVPTRRRRSGIDLTRGTTIAVLASAILLREGIICVLLALPLILPIVGVISWSTRRSQSGHRFALVIPLLVLGVSGEGVVYELPSHHSVSESRVVQSSSAELLESLAAPAELPPIEPALFALPFPKPVEFTGEGLYIGAARTVDFGEMGSLDIRVSAVDTYAVTWEFAENSTPLGSWMTFHSAEVSWVERADGIELTVEIVFDRSLAPAFYFQPLENWGVGEMAEVMIDMIEHNLELAASAG